MSSPSHSSSVTRPDLRGQVYMEWGKSGIMEMFVAGDVLPRVDVDEPAAVYRMIDREQFLEDVDTLRQGDGGYTRSEWSDDELNYSTRERGHEVKIDHNARAATRRYYDSELVATKLALLKVRRDHEKRVADLVMNATTFSGHTAAINGVKWETVATADPVNDIAIGKRAVEAACGFPANALVIPHLTWEWMINCDGVLDRIGSASSVDPKVLTRRSMSTLLDLPKIIIPRGKKNASDTPKGEGITSTFASVWDTDKVLVAYIPDQVTLEEPCLGMTWNYEGDGGAWDFTVEKYYSEEKRGDVIRARRQVKPEVRDAAFGYLLTTVLTK